MDPPPPPSGGLRAGRQAWEGLGYESGHKLHPAPFSTQESGWSVGAQDPDQAFRKSPVITERPSCLRREEFTCAMEASPSFKRKHEPL